MTLAIVFVLGAVVGTFATWYVMLPRAVRRGIEEQKAYEESRAIGFFPDYLGVPYDAQAHRRAIEQRAHGFFRRKR